MIARGGNVIAVPPKAVALALAAWVGVACGACGDDPPASSSSGSSGTASSSGGSSGGSSGAVDSGSGGNCSLPKAPGGFQAAQKLTVGGATRTYSIAVPADYDATRSYPVIFAFHGDGGDGASARGAFKLEATHGNEAILVYPDGLNRTWDLDTWDDATNPDIRFMDALVAAVKATYCAASFYAVGFSRGGFFANHVGCHRGNLFRAVSSHGGGGPYDATLKNFDAQGNLICPTKPVPALLVIGANDGLLNDSNFSRKYWTFANGCQTAAAATDPSPCVAQQGCQKPVEWCQIPGLGHGIWQNAAETTWKFFMAN
jgi:polyhydroxybutyrate depolymerase